MLGLLFRFDGDNSPIKRAMDGIASHASVVGESAGKQMGNQMKSAILRFVGAGAIIGSIKNAMQEGVAAANLGASLGVSPESAQELKKAQELTGLSIDELRKLSVDFPKPFAKLMEDVRASGGIIDNSTAESLANSSENLSSVWSIVGSKLAIVTERILRLVGAQGALVQMAGTGIAGAFTGKDSLKQESLLQLQIAKDIFNEGIVPGSNGRKSARSLMDSVRERKAFIGGLSGSLESAGNNLGQMSKVGVFGSVIEEMVKELKKANGTLKQIEDNGKALY